MENYRELVILQRSMVLVDRIKEIAGTFPTAERYGLVEEMQQVVSAIPANVVQGYDGKALSGVSERTQIHLHLSAVNLITAEEHRVIVHDEHVGFVFFARFN